jgi:hypothetical protein
LGQYLPPYGANDAPLSIPAPLVELGDMGIEQWQYDVWFKVIQAALNGHPDQVSLSYHAGLKRPATSRYGATTPALLRWFGAFNCSRHYPDQVKPFNFLNAFHAQLQFELPEAERWGMLKRGRPRKQLDAKPVSAFNKDLREAAQRVFDRETGKPISADRLISYAEALAQYHLRPEAKFLNGDFCDRGRTKRRHVVVTQIVHIGKEANKWEEQYFLGADEDAEIEYGVGQTAADALDLRLRELCCELGEREASRKLGISRTSLRRAMRLGVEAMSRAMRGRLATKL